MMNHTHKTELGIVSVAVRGAKKYPHKAGKETQQHHGSTAHQVRTLSASGALLNARQMLSPDMCGAGCLPVLWSD